MRTVKTLLFHWFQKPYPSALARDREFCNHCVATGRDGVPGVSMACQEVAMDPNGDPAALRGIHVAIGTMKQCFFISSGSLFYPHLCVTASFVTVASPRGAMES